MFVESLASPHGRGAAEGGGEGSRDHQIRTEFVGCTAQSVGQAAMDPPELCALPHPLLPSQSATLTALPEGEPSDGADLETVR